MSDADIRREPSGDGFVIDDGYDLWIFDEAPGSGPYASFAEAQTADRMRTDLAGGASPD
jgi:hypothetical protein